jgi:hypothetical protein
MTAPTVADVLGPLSYSLGQFSEMAGVFAAVGESPSPLNFARVLSRQLPTQTFKSMLEAGKLDKCTGKCNGDADVCKMSTLEEDIAKRVERFHAFAARAQELSKLKDFAATAAAHALFPHLSVLISGGGVDILDWEGNATLEGAFPLAPTALPEFSLSQRGEARDTFGGDRAWWFNLLYDCGADVATTARCPRAWEAHLISLFAMLLVHYVPAASPWPDG